MTLGEQNDGRAKVDSELLVSAIVILVLVVGIEGVLLGWGVAKAAQLVINVPRPDRSLAFIEWFALIITPLLAVNAALGAYIAYELSAPLNRIRKAMNEITRGNLEHELELPAGGLLRDYSLDCQKMLQTLRRLVYRDHGSATEAGALLAQCQKLLSEQQPGVPLDLKKLGELLTEVRSELSVINYHFTKGRREQT